MQGKQNYQEELFTTFSLTEMVPDTHLLKRIDNLVDMEFVRELTLSEYSRGKGRVSIDPVVFFRMQLIRYLYGIPSDRRLCEEIHLNIAYRWFCRLQINDKVPHHSSLTRIRDRFGVEIFCKIFEELLLLLKEKGLIKGERLLVDASVFEADASLNSLEPCVPPTSGEMLLPHQERYHDFREGNKRRRYSNKTHVSASDPDATLVSRPGKPSKLSYKAHFTVDAASRVIVDAHLTTGSTHEVGVLNERVDHLIDCLNLPIKEVTADKGYGRGPNYAHLKARGIRAYIPLHHRRTGLDTYDRSAFEYQRKRDRFKCPRGHYLYPYEKLDRTQKRYRMVGGRCKHCPLRAACLPENHKNRSRFINRSPHQDEIDRIRKRQETKHFKKKLVERQWKIESLFGEAKTQHGMRRANYRGWAKVQIQIYLTAICQNLKRLARSFKLFFLFKLIVKRMRNLCGGLQDPFSKIALNYHLFRRGSMFVSSQ